MLFWAILTLLVVFAAVALTIPLVRHYDLKKGESMASMMAAQLADIDRQVETGEVTPEAANDLRTELKRRILVEGRTDEHAAPLPFRSRALTGFGVAIIVAAAAVGLYAFLGAPSLGEIANTTSPVAAPATASTPDPTRADTIRELTEKLKLTPGDADGWQLLGETYFEGQQYPEAANAYAKAHAIAPDNSTYASAMGESLVMAASGEVTPGAQNAFAAARKADPKDVRARFYLALGEDQAGRTPAAVDAWIAILNESAADAPWVPLVQRTVEERAKAAHIDIKGRIHLRPATAATSTPAEDQVKALQALPPAERQAMIRSMVERLADNLKANPQNPEGWMRLMQARVVLADKAGAEKAYADARAAYKGDAKMQAQLAGLAKNLGIKG